MSKRLKDIELSDIKLSLEQYVSDGIEERQESIRPTRKREDEGQRVERALDKLFIPRYLHEIELLRDLRRCISDMDIGDDFLRVFPSDLKNAIVELSENLPYDEKVKLQKLINNSIREELNPRERKVETAKANAKKIVEQKIFLLSPESATHLDEKMEIYHYESDPIAKKKVREKDGKDSFGNDKFKILYVGEVTEIIDEFATRSMIKMIERIRNNGDLQTVNLKAEPERKYDLSETSFPDGLLEKINYGRLEMNETNMKIIRDLDKIKEAFITKKRLEDTISKLDSVIRIAAKYNNLDNYDSHSYVAANYKEITRTLLSAQKKAAHELDKINKFLAKYDFKAVELEIKQDNDKIQADYLKQGTMAEYARLISEYEAANEAGDIEKKRELEEEIQKLRRTTNLTESEAWEAVENGKEKHHNDKMNAKIDAQIRKEQEEEIRKNEQAYADYLRKMAIDNIESRGGYKPQYEERNLDVYDADSYENAIQREMKRIREEEEKKAAERAIEAEKQERIRRKSEEYKQAEIEMMAAVRNFADFDIKHVENVKGSDNDIKIAIEKRIKEILSWINLTPVQRGIQDHINKGDLPMGTTEKDITPQQRNDFSIGYSDSVLGYTAARKLLSRGEMFEVDPELEVAGRTR